jgi:hypothetical protein
MMSSDQPETIMAKSVSEAVERLSPRLLEHNCDDSSDPTNSSCACETIGLRVNGKNAMNPEYFLAV